MANHSFQTVEDMLNELDSLASSSCDEDEYTESSASCESMTGSETSSSATSNAPDVQSNHAAELPIITAVTSHENDNNVDPADDEEVAAPLMSAIRQYCCSCDLLKIVWKRVLYAQQEESSIHEPLLTEEATIDSTSSLSNKNSSPSNKDTSRSPAAPIKRSLSAEERVMALIHQKQSSTLGQGPKPFDILQEILLTQQQRTTCHSSKDLPADYWVPWNTDGYSLELTQAVRKGNLPFVQSYKGNLQCSSPYGESILHVTARRGDLTLLQYMHSERHISLRVCCESARNILHDACWTSRPSFECIRWLLEQVPELLLVQDARGRTPLEYAPADTWEEWNAFLKEHPQLVCHSAERLEELLA